MNEKVKAFLDAKKEEEKKQKNDFLVSLGLFDEASAKRYISKEEALKRNDYQYDYDTQQYYYECKTAIEVSDEEYAEICKYASIKKGDSPADTSFNPDCESENHLNGWATCIKVIGIIALIVCAIVGIIMGFDGEPGGWGIFFGGVVIFCSNFLICNIAKVFINISLRLNAIYKKLK